MKQPSLIFTESVDTYHNLGGLDNRICFLADCELKLPDSTHGNG